MSSLIKKVRDACTITRTALRYQISQITEKTRNQIAKMIGPLEKGFKAAEIRKPPPGVYQDIDLSVLPKYLCFRAAMLREKQTLQTVLVVLVALFSVLYLTSRFEISSLHKRLRLKEFILAPGVVDFTAASPQTIPDGYITDAVTDFVSNLGNVNASTIEEQYEMLMRFYGGQAQGGV